MTIFRHASLGAGAASLAVLAGLAAAPRAATAGEYKVYSPHVEQGETEIESRSSYNIDDSDKVDGSRAYKLAVGHAFTNFWASEVYGVFKHGGGGGDTKLEAVEWENIFQLTPQGKYWADFGVRAEGEFPTRDGNPYEFQIGPLVEKAFGRTVATVNLYVERQFGSNAVHDTEFGYSARLRYRLNSFFEPALEAYGSPGYIENFAPSNKQRHQIGPGFYGQAHLGNGGQKIKYSAAALRGITDAGSPDWTLVTRFEYEF